MSQSAPLSQPSEGADIARLPRPCLDRFDSAVADMLAEDTKPLRARDSRVYAYAYGVIETFGLMLRVTEPDNPDAVRDALARVATADDDMFVTPRS